MVECLPLTINKVQEHEELIREVLSKSFWQSVSYEAAGKMLAGLAPLMPYMRKEPQQTIVIDMGDEIALRERILMTGEKEQTYITKYREQVEDRIRKIADENPAIQKIARDEVLSEADIHGLEAALFGPDLARNDPALDRAVTDTGGAIVPFIRRVLGMYGGTGPRSGSGMRSGRT